MFRNVFWMGLSSAARLGAGFILFILIARHLGPAESLVMICSGLVLPIFD
jgi:O-antigen/teichoic acid export membrane protein